MAKKEDKKKKVTLTILTVIAIGSLSLFTYITFTPSEKARSYGECKTLYDNKDYDGCIACFNEYVANHPKPEPPVYQMRGLSYFNKGNYKEAIDDFTEFLKTNKHSHTIYYKRGLAYEKANDPVKAEEDFKKACMYGYEVACNKKVASVGDFVDTGNETKRTANDWYNIGIGFCGTGDYKKALEPLNAAVKLDPKMTDAYLFRGLTYRKLNKYNEAMEDYNKIISLEPNNKKAFNNRGVVYWKLKKYNEALVDYNKTISLDPNDYVVYNNRGVLHFEMGNYEKALLDYNKAIELNPTFAESYWNRGVNYIKLGKTDEAKKDFKKACDLDLKDACKEMNNL